MKVSQVITDVRRELLESGADASFWTDSELIRLINRGQFDYVNRTRILEDRAILSLEVGRADYPLPANWLSDKAIYHIKTIGGKKNQRRLNPSDLERMSTEVPNFLITDDSDRYARPSKFWVWGTTLYVDAPPDEVEDSDLIMFYKSKPSRITDTTQDIQIPEELADGLNAYVLWRAWTKEKEKQFAADNLAIYLDFIKQGLRYVKRKVGDRQGKIDVQSPFPFTGSSDPGYNPLA